VVSARGAVVAAGGRVAVDSGRDDVAESSPHAARARTASTPMEAEVERTIVGR
jgi:hypothetical protein